MGYLETEPNANSYTEMKENLKKTIGWIFLKKFLDIVTSKVIIWFLLCLHKKKSSWKRVHFYSFIILLLSVSNIIFFIEGLLK